MTNASDGATLDTYTHTGKILRDLRKMTNNILEGWIIQTSYFQYLKNIITKLRNRTALESTYLVMKKNNHTLFTFLKKV